MQILKESAKVKNPMAGREKTYTFLAEARPGIKYVLKEGY